LRTETVAEAFADYRAKVLPPNAPDVQITECQRAFYAGAYFLLMNLAANIGDESTPEEEGIVELEKLKAECEAFAAAEAMPLPKLVPPDIHYTVPDPLDIQTKLKTLAAFIKDDYLPEGWGFTLLLFSYSEKGSLFYISSAERSDVLNVMREFIRRQTQ
jgi:hypothetical protein